MNGPTMVPCRVITASTAIGGVVLDPVHDLRLVAGDGVGVTVPAGLVGDEERGLAGIAVRQLDHQVVPEAGRVAIPSSSG